MNICEHLTATARLFPDKEAIAFEGERLTYGQLDQLTMQAANVLAAANVNCGDRVAIMLPNTPSFVVWYYATLRLGAIAVSVSTRLTEDEVSYVAANSGARAFVADPSVIAAVMTHLPDCVAETFVASDDGRECNGESFATSTEQRSNWFNADPNDAALILYTSGTTGFAKGATLSHMNVRSNAAAFNHLCDMKSTDRILLAVPLFHCFGQNALLNSAFNVGATIVLQRRFDPHESTRLIQEERVTQLYGVPTMFHLLNNCCERKQLSTVRYCFSAAATLPIQVSQRWQDKFGMPIYEGYGLTETSPFASYNHRNRYEMGSIGTPIDCVEMKIVDTKTGATCMHGELGEIAIRGPNVMLGYWNRPDDTANAIRAGWFHSGDIGRQDDQGFFYIVDRVKDMINVGGINVYPAEVERVLLDHSCVSQAAVVGFADDIFGEQVVAFVILTDGNDDVASTSAKIKQFAKEKLANYKTPSRVIAIDELPRNPSGKVLKTKLREYNIATETETEPTSAEASEGQPETVTPHESYVPVLRQQLAASYASDRQNVAMAYIQDAVRTLTGSEALPTPDSRFLDVGLDSLMIVDFGRQLQAEIGRDEQIPATLVFDYPRIRDLAGFLIGVLTSDEEAETKQAASPAIPQGDSIEAAPQSKQSINSPAARDVASLSEEEALDELLRELEN